MAKERYDCAVLLTWRRCSYMYSYVHASACYWPTSVQQDQHYTHAMSPSCNHPNGDGWPALSTQRHDEEGARPKAMLACRFYMDT